MGLRAEAKIKEKVVPHRKRLWIIISTLTPLPSKSTGLGGEG